MSKTAELLIKEGFSSMEALQLVDSDVLTNTKIPRGQQKLLINALRSLQLSTEMNRTGTNAPATCASEAASERSAARPATIKLVFGALRAIARVQSMKKKDGHWNIVALFYLRIKMPISFHPQPLSCHLY